MYRAIRVAEFGAPEVLKVAEVPLLKPALGEVLVRVRAIGVNPVDTYIRSGAYGRLPPLPYTPGSDAAGVVEGVGEGVKGFKEGDRVYVCGASSGSYAELALAKESCVFPLPDALDYEQGAALGVPYFTAYRALFRSAKLESGEWVLIHGASGGVGVAAVQQAKAVGAHVIGTAGTEAGMALVKSVGADVVLNHREEGMLEAVVKASSGGVNVLVEMLANVNLAKDMNMLAYGGRIAVVGNRGSIEVNPRDLMTREASVAGVALAFATDEEKSRTGHFLSALARTGAISPVIGPKFTMEDAAKAHVEVIEHAAGSAGKVVIALDGSTEKGAVPAGGGGGGGGGGGSA